MLKRAIMSIREAANARIAVIVVVNGTRFDKELCARIRAQDDVRVEYLEQASLPRALLRGRDLVDTEFFSTLDDDDEYLPNGLTCRVAALEATGADLVITNGYRHVLGRDEPFDPAIQSVPEARLPKLFERNWLTSCNALFRSSSVGREYFADYHQFFEWTWLAFKLALSDLRMVAIPDKTFRYNDTPNSLSKSAAYLEADVELYRRMLAKTTAPDVARLIHRRLAAALHDRSVRELAQGNRAKALGFHMRSLFHSGGLQYLAYSRRLLPGWPQP